MAAIMARKRIAEISNVKSSQHKPQPPLHGWDYEQMMEMWLHDDLTYSTVGNYHNHNYSDRESANRVDLVETASSSVSPTTDDSSDDTIILEDDLHLESPPRLPTDLLGCQNLGVQLNLPEIIQAAEEGDRDRRLSSRHRNAPSNYARFSRTGKR